MKKVRSASLSESQGQAATVPKQAKAQSPGILPANQGPQIWVTNPKQEVALPQAAFPHSTFTLGLFGSFFPKKSSGREMYLHPTQNGEAGPCSPMVCLLSGGMESSKTLNDRCYLICCRSCWKIVWKALAAEGKLEIQLTPTADRSFQASSISIISPSRNFVQNLVCK